MIIENPAQRQGDTRTPSHNMKGPFWPNAEPQGLRNRPKTNATVNTSVGWAVPAGCIIGGHSPPLYRMSILGQSPSRPTPDSSFRNASRATARHHVRFAGLVGNDAFQDKGLTEQLHGFLQAEQAGSRAGSAAFIAFPHELWYHSLQCKEELVMLSAIEGTYRNGKIELREVPADAREGAPVIVTFLETQALDLRARGIDERQAAELRARLAAFAEDWESPEMDVYDHYDAAKARL